MGTKAHTKVCSRVTIAGMVPSFERFACSVIPAAPETDVGRLLDQGQLKQHNQTLLLLAYIWELGAWMGSHYPN